VNPNPMNNTTKYNPSFVIMSRQEIEE